MPEKPEVITVAKSLETNIIGKKILDCHIYWDNIIASPTSKEFQKEIKNQTIHKITTRGKFLVLELDQYSLLIHLRMEGKFLFRKKEDKIGKHEHVEFLLDNGESFRYHDVRKFGKMYLIPKEDTYRVKPLSELGYEYDNPNLSGITGLRDYSKQKSEYCSSRHVEEAFEDDNPNLTKEYLYQRIHSKRLPIKTVLLDQSIIAGIGNIYDNEILFMSKISPERSSCKITKNECQEIIDDTRIVLKKAIALGGTTIRSFTSSEGIHGLFQNELLVHGKKNCPNCGKPVKKIQIGGRGTYYCSSCQK